MIVALVAGGCASGPYVPARGFGPLPIPDAHARAAMARKVALLVPGAPGEVRTFCEWDAGSDSNGIGCYVYIVVPSSRQPGPADLAWLTAFENASWNGIASDAGDFGMHGGRPVGINAVQLAVSNAVGAIQPVTWQCVDPQLNSALDGSRALTVADVEADHCTFEPDALTGLRVANALETGGEARFPP